MRAIQRTVHLVITSSAVIGGILVVLACMAVIYEIIARYGFNAPTTWSIDVTVLFVTWATLLAGAYALREQGHVAVDVVTRRLPPAMHRMVSALVYLAVAAFAAVIAWSAGFACWEAYQYGEIMMSVVRIPMYVPLLALVVGPILILLQALLLAFNCAPGNR